MMRKESEYLILIVKTKARAQANNTEFQVTINTEGAWKRANLFTTIMGSQSEGVIIQIDTVAAQGDVFAIGNFMLRVRTR